MKGDFTRDTYNPAKHFARVLLQQGRVQLDSDWNEQVAILLHYMQTLAGDLIGPHAGPASDLGFGLYNNGNIKDLPTTSPAEEEFKKKLTDYLTRNKTNFVIGSGRYYVGGQLIENDGIWLFKSNDPSDPAAQPDYVAEKALEAGNNYMLFVDVWEKYTSYLEDDEIREVALNGPDTAARTRLVWQLKALNQKELNDKFDYDGKLLGVFGKLASATAAASPDIDPNVEIPSWLKSHYNSPTSTALLTARSQVKNTDFTPCAIPPEARYRGEENQLYRVEIHTGGEVGTATFKWSRENGSVAFAVLNVENTLVSLASLGHDAHLGLTAGDWVEITNDDTALAGNAPNPLLQIEAIDPLSLTVTLSDVPKIDIKEGNLTAKHAVLRRWEQKTGVASEGGLTIDKDGAAKVVEGTADNNWLNLEDGVQIQFSAPATAIGAAGEGIKNTYRSGDYWLIPARVATGDVEWPGPVENPTALPPRSIPHYYAPIGFLSFNAAGTGKLTDLRRSIKTL